MFLFQKVCRRVWLLVVAGAALAACGGGGRSPSAPGDAPPGSGAAGCSRTSIGASPLEELGTGTYQGAQGGLYPGGSSARPPAHDAAGLGLARAIGPLDSAGRPSASGRYVFVSIGMSNTTQEFSAFKPMADADPSRDPRLVIVDGAQGGVDSSQWASGGCSCWSTLSQRLSSAGVSAAQVAVAWVKIAIRAPTAGWPAETERLRTDTISVLRQLRSRYPNLAIAYLSSRIYAGYATGPLNPEFYAYESGFAMKWVIEDQLSGSPTLNWDPSRGAVVAPWVAWGPYLWADGLRPRRSDGLTWACSDFRSDGTHPTGSGEQKVANQLLQFVRTDSTAREWFLANP